jgi:hypothetical protein
VIRRLNFTGRKKISRDAVTIRLLPGDDGVYAFAAEFDLAPYAFPEDASVFIEAYNTASYMRFAFGTVGKRRDPESARLAEITPRPLPKFRLKVVDRRRRHGLLLGVADKLIPLRPHEEVERRKSLLPVLFDDLGDRVWRLDLSDWPVLELNNRVDLIGEAARSGDAFLGLVYPEVVRRILHEILIVNEQTDPEFDDADWMSLWLRYVCALPGVAEPPAGFGEDARSRRLEWIDETVEAFCRSRQARQRFATALGRDTL